MTVKQSRGNRIQLTEVFYRADRPSFQHTIEELFKAYIKSCGSSYKKGEPI